MASQHKLAQSVRTNFSNIMEGVAIANNSCTIHTVAILSVPLIDVSLPAILMPTKLGHVYSPRAHCYFHPTGKYSLAKLVFITICVGTSEPRVTQAPAMVKLPVLKNKDVSLR